MKKILAIVVLCFVLTGCSFGKNSQYQAKVKRYESLLQAILDNDKFQSESNNFDLEVIMNQEESGYSYDIIVDNPKVAMYNIEITVVENNQGFNEEKMMVSSGVFEDARSMIPGQVNTSAGYVGGMILNALTPNDEVNLKVLVTWKDNGLANSFYEYVEVNAKMSNSNGEEGKDTESSETQEENQDGESTEG